MGVDFVRVDLVGGHQRYYDLSCFNTSNSKPGPGRRGVLTTYSKTKVRLVGVWMMS